MNSKSTISTTLFAIFFIVSCHSADQNTDAEIKTEITTPVSAIKQINKTVADGNRLTQQSLSSYLPQQMGAYKKSGEATLKVTDRTAQTGGIYHTLSQYYSNGAAGMSLRITDHADDPGHINTVQQGNIKLSDTEDENLKHKVYVDGNGWYVTEMELYRGVGNDKVVTSSDVTVKNPRFSIFLKATPERGTSALETGSLLQLIQNSKLPDLFSLPVPQGESEVNQNESRKALDCDQILPESILSEVCNTTGISIAVSDFEKKFNCNRSYKSKEKPTNSLVFILTQYANAETSSQAVAVKKQDIDLNGKPIDNLGDDAVITYVDEDMYMSVAYQNYLIELRSFKYKFRDTDNMCYSEAALVKLANAIIANL